MVLAQDFLTDLQCLAEEQFGPPIIALAKIQVGQIVQAGGIIGMVLAQDLLTDFHGLAQQRSGPQIIALVNIDDSQTVQAGEIVGVVLAEGLLADLQGMVEERFGLGVLAEVLVLYAEVVKANCGIFVFRAEDGLRDFQGLLGERQGLARPASRIKLPDLQAKLISFAEALLLLGGQWIVRRKLFGGRDRARRPIRIRRLCAAAVGPSRKREQNDCRHGNDRTRRAQSRPFRQEIADGLPPLGVLPSHRLLSCVSCISWSVHL